MHGQQSVKICDLMFTKFKTGEFCEKKFWDFSVVVWSRTNRTDIVL